jgi:hypothetical protein
MSPEKHNAGDFLRPETVSRLANMELRARLIVEGFIAGLHRSPYHGFSAEFAEYRQYNAGESTKNIDWKIYAKTDRYYLKVFEDETNLRGTLLLDRSASMDFSGGGVTKLRYLPPAQDTRERRAGREDGDQPGAARNGRADTQARAGRAGERHDRRAGGSDQRAEAFQAQGT